jgi:hypothetical protein
MAIQENAVWSVAIPIARNARPKTRNNMEYLLRGCSFFIGVIIHKNIYA